MTAPYTIPCPACDAPHHPEPGEDVLSARCSACASPLFTGRPIHLTTERINAHAVAHGLPLVIDFWADWCGPCKTMAPVFEGLAREFEPHLRFAKVDTDAEGQLAEHFGIRTIPTLSVIRDRKEVARVAGVMFAGDLRRWLFAALSEHSDEAAAAGGLARTPT